MKTLPTSSAHQASRDLSIDYLRACATVMVVVIHCSAPYTALVQRTQQILWQAPIPILDTVHSRALTALLVSLDASTMSLMFFISGLFTYPALRRKGGWVFIKERAVRLGLPFLAMTLLWMPLAYYAPWNLEHPGGSLRSFLTVNAHARFSSGPGWFLWLLLFFDCAAAAIYAVSGELLERAAPWLQSFGRMQGAWPLLMVLAGAGFYVPFALHNEGSWASFVTAPFMLQPARALFYAAWFVAGILVGSVGLKQGLLSREGPLARRWATWALVGFSAGSALLIGSRAHRLLMLLPFRTNLMVALLWVLADVGICFGLLALFRGCVSQRRAWADSLARNAYVIYVLHYVFAMWLERWLLPERWPALAKFSAAFAGTLMLSWGAAIVWLRLWQRSIRLFKRNRPSEQTAGALSGAA